MMRFHILGMLHSRQLFVAILVVALVGNLQAAVMCVDSVSGLQVALNLAASNSQGDTINVVAGTYAVTAPLTATITDNLDVEIIGGWNSGCTVRGGNGNTILDGQQQTAVLDIEAQVGSPAGIGFAFLTITGGYQNSSGVRAAAGAAVYTAGPVTVESNVFYANQHNGVYAGGLYVYSGAGSTLTVRNNVFFGNTSAAVGAADLYSNGGTAHVYGNSIVANQVTGTSSIGGIFARGPGAFNIANNLFWNNTGGDLFNAAGLGSGSMTMYNNDVGSVLGAAIAGGSGNFNLDPRFQPSLLSMRPRSNSPLINAGLDLVDGGLGAYDVTGAQRRQLPHVDIGAYESDFIFYGAFEPL